MHIVRFTSFFCVLLLLVSCTGNRNKKKTTPSRLQLTDTALVQAEAEANRNPYAPVDVSPMDMSYYPVDYTKLKMAGSVKESPVARVIYSRPHLQGRVLFDDVLNYDEPWRMGANESTEIQLFRNIIVQDKIVNEGRYILYCIPHENNWTIVFNKNIDTWGLKPDSTKDAYHFTIPIKRTDNHLEYFTMTFEKAGAGANLLMAWDDVEARMHFTFQ